MFKKNQRWIGLKKNDEKKIISKDVWTAKDGLFTLLGAILLFSLVLIHADSNMKTTSAKELCERQGLQLSDVHDNAINANGILWWHAIENVKCVELTFIEIDFGEIRG